MKIAIGVLTQKDKRKIRSQFRRPHILPRKRRRKKKIEEEEEEEEETNRKMRRNNSLKKRKSRKPVILCQQDKQVKAKKDPMFRVLRNNQVPLLF